MLEAVIFDMDGVIIDSEPIHFEVDKMMLKNCGVNILAEELHEYVGMTSPEMWTRLKEKYKIKLSVEELMRLQLDTKLNAIEKMDEKPISGVLSLLKSLRENSIKIALASSAPRQLIMAVLKKFDIENYFHIVLSGEKVEKGKPKPDIFEEISRILNIAPENCLVIEDSQNGVKAEKCAGMKCIGFINENSGMQDLSLADLVIDSLEKVNLSLIRNLYEIGV